MIGGQERPLKWQNLLRTRERVKRPKQNVRKKRNSAVRRLVNAKPTLSYAQGMKIQTWRECNRGLSPNLTGCKIWRKMQMRIGRDEAQASGRGADVLGMFRCRAISAGVRLM